jgi:hypothetical protein
MLLKHGIDINDCHDRCKHVKYISRIIGNDYSRFQTFDTDLSELDGIELFNAQICNTIAKQQHKCKSQIFDVLSNHYYKLSNESKNVIK